MNEHCDSAWERIGYNGGHRSLKIHAERTAEKLGLPGFQLIDRHLKEVFYTGPLSNDVSEKLERTAF